ncbi:hypothetical protein [Verrucomicrobium spinosum]|uniref:hypothetical protein n=1 Tax=Verrucomicrobium spinosum TaxID=2736 RepID=UPI00094650DF|nr:hypothetical protein [Verrucomicrobium spinosum]
MKPLPLTLALLLALSQGVGTAQTALPSGPLRPAPLRHLPQHPVNGKTRNAPRFFQAFPRSQGSEPPGRWPSGEIWPSP